MENFTCIADKCKHSCCIGWEIDIDSDTMDKYRAVEGPFREKLLKNIATDSDGTSHFILDENERCPFLNKTGLCDIILNLGEEYLSEICTEHPRFYIQSDSSVITGYGLCCEKAAQLTLFGDLSDSYIPNVDTDIEEMCKEYSNYPDFPATANWLDLCDFLLKLESLSDTWNSWINYLKVELSSPSGKIKDSSLSPTIEKAFYNLMKYLLFRHQNELFASIMWQFIRKLYSFLLMDDGDNELVAKLLLINVCREYSCEIEYSDQNPAALLDYFINHM